MLTIYLAFRLRHGISLDYRVKLSVLRIPAKDINDQ